MAFGQPLSMSAINAAMAWLQDEKYIPIKATAGKENLDFSLLYGKSEKQEFKKESEHFNNALPSSDDFTAYLLKSSILTQYRTMDRMPDDAIIVTLAGPKSQDKFFVCFELAKKFTISPLK